MTSSPLAVDGCDGHDVFLSFRGTDTRNNFTSHLYDALCRAEIKAFIDNELERGEEITPALERVIEGAKISIIVFSPDYATSTFCLDELVKIMECKESNGQTVLPIFYQVYPLPTTYSDAFTRHKETIKPETKVNGWKLSFWEKLNLASDWKAFERCEEERISRGIKVERWESAFGKALNLAGWHIDYNIAEAEVIGDITRKILKNLKSRQFKGEKLMSTSLVGQTANANLDRIWQCLMNDETSRVGVYGMGGAGKTATVTHINNRLLADDNSFTRIYWVTVSKNSSIYKLQSDIAKVVNVDLSGEDGEQKRATKLWEKLDKIGKFVMILDDVWEAFETAHVGIPLLVNRGKLLLTTRKLKVCQRMECQPIQVELLSEEEAWDLFIKESKHKINGSQEMRRIVKSVVQECAGLPLAIVVIARRMRGVEKIGEWRNILRELRKPYEGHNHEMEEKVFKPLKVSYDHLPNHFQQCFLYCSLFPEDYKIDYDDLIDYWIGVGLIDELASRQAELDMGDAIINEFILASLLEHGEYTSGSKFVKMHDVVRDMACIVIRDNFKGQVGFQLEHLLKETKCSVHPETCLIMDNTMSERGVSNLALSCFSLRTLIFSKNSYLTVLPGNFFANMQNLAVLDMRYQIRLKLLPDSITQLGNLKVLLLSGCKSLKYIPCLARLENLWHLDLLGTNLEEIPKGIDRLVNLKVLKYSHSGLLYKLFPSGVLQKLSNLRSLQFENVEVEPDAIISLAKVETLRVKFYYLDTLQSYLKSGHWQKLAEYQIYYFARRRSSDFKLMSQKYEKVMSLDQIRDIGVGNFIFPDDIQYLELVDWDSPMDGVFRSSSFANLRRLEIRGYRAMHLFTPASAQLLLHTVEELIISGKQGTNKLEKIIATEEKLVNQSNSYPSIELPKLKSLRLMSLPELRGIYRGRMVCPSIECIKVDDCGKLASLPFFMQEDNKENPRMALSSIKLEVTGVARSWWDSLEWDDPNAKSIYQLALEDCYSSMSYLDSDS